MYIVTGGAGFIGSAMVWKLNQMGIDDIIVVDNLASSEKWHNLVNRRFTDYLHRDTFRKMLEDNRLHYKIDGIIHLGACSSTTERNVDFLMENNVKYSELLCRRAMERGVRFINASSAATYGDGSMGFSDSRSMPTAGPNSFSTCGRIVKNALLPSPASSSSTSMARTNTTRAT